MQEGLRWKSQIVYQSFFHASLTPSHKTTVPQAFSWVWSAHYPASCSLPAIHPCSLSAARNTWKWITYYAQAVVVNSIFQSSSCNVKMAMAFRNRNACSTTLSIPKRNADCHAHFLMLWAATRAQKKDCSILFHVHRMHIDQLTTIMSSSGANCSV